MIVLIIIAASCTMVSNRNRFSVSCQAVDLV
nr:MAG TPA: hypothetical protein [Caudoviricetes sp.]